MFLRVHWPLTHSPCLCRSDKGVVEQGVLVVANGCSDYNALAAVQDLWLRLAKLTTDLRRWRVSFATAAPPSPATRAILMQLDAGESVFQSFMDNNSV